MSFWRWICRRRIQWIKVRPLTTEEQCRKEDGNGGYCRKTFRSAATSCTATESLHHPVVILPPSSASASSLSLLLLPLLSSSTSLSSPMIPTLATRKRKKKSKKKATFLVFSVIHYRSNIPFFLFLPVFQLLLLLS